MKITKTKLKQIIQEELSALAEDPKNEAMEPIDSPRDTIARSASKIAMISKVSLEKPPAPEALKSNLEQINQLAGQISSLLDIMDDPRF